MAAAGGTWSHGEQSADKNILDWTGQDCVNWARRVCEAQGLDPTTCDERRLLLLTGPQLLTLTAHELALTVGVFNAPLFRQCLDRIAPLQADDFRAHEARNQPLQCGAELAWPEDGAPTSSAYHSLGRSELDRPMGPPELRPYMSRNSDGFWPHQNLHDTPGHPWQRGQEFAGPHSIAATSSCFETRRGKHPSLPETTADYGAPFLSLPTEELPQLDLLTVTDVLNDRSAAGCSDSRPHQKTGSRKAKQSSLKGAGKFGPDCSQSPQRRGRSSIEDPPMCISPDLLDSDCWFAPYRVDRDRVRRPEVWEYILRLLQDPRTEGHLVGWEDRPRGVFKVLQRRQVARMWRDHWHPAKRGTPVNYENFAKNLSYHYSTGVLVRVPEQSTYQLGCEVLQKLDAGYRW